MYVCVDERGRVNNRQKQYVRRSFCCLNTGRSKREISPLFTVPSLDILFALNVYLSEFKLYIQKDRIETGSGVWAVEAKGIKRKDGEEVSKGERGENKEGEAGRGSRMRDDRRGGAGR